MTEFSVRIDRHVNGHSLTFTAFMDDLAEAKTVAAGFPKYVGVHHYRDFTNPERTLRFKVQMDTDIVTVGRSNEHQIKRLRSFLRHLDRLGHTLTYEQFNRPALAPAAAEELLTQTAGSR